MKRLNITDPSSHKIWIGTSGWSYKHWSGTFYPEDVKSRDHFQYYQSHFDTVELNNSFYRLPTAETFSAWRLSVSDDFLFAVKASRYITHMKKLKDPVESSSKFFDNVTALEQNLGPILFQLPPGWKLNFGRFSEFLEKLPPTFRYTFEFRNHNWYNPQVYDALKQYNCAFCIYDLAGHQSPIEVTADFVYVRLHGPDGKYDGSYSDDQLQKWADRIKKWAISGDVFVYFDNDIGGHAPHNAMRLKQLLAS